MASSKGNIQEINRKEGKLNVLQREVAQADEEIHHPMLGRRVHHLHRTTQQLAVDAGIDLGEIGRAKRNAYTLLVGV